MTELYTHEPDDFLAGDEPLKTGRAMMATGQSCERLTPLMLSDTGLLTVWDGSPGAAVAMSAKAVNALTVDTKVPYYKAGCFRISKVVWPDGLTEAQKRAAFIGSPVSVDDEQ